MWLGKEGAFFFVFLCAIAPTTAHAQQNRETSSARYRPNGGEADRREKPPASRMLGADEGLAILGAARESRSHPGSKSDCSHLVHVIYERAGFPYSYVSSSDLYAGIDEFRRVIRPQAGDVVAWPGHVGIVVNPTQRSFFSALRSGLGVDSYDSAYWRERGRPRFFRYVRPVRMTLQAAAASRTPNLKPAAMPSPEPDLRLPRNADFHPGEEAETAVGPTSAHSEIAPPNIIIPRTQVVNSERPRPAEVSAALDQAFSDTREALRGQNILKLSQPLVVFDQLTVERVSLKRNQGWAEISIIGAFPVPGEKANPKKHSQRQRWLLSRRDDQAWELRLPPEAIYVPHDIAVRMLAHQLAVLTEDAPSRTHSQAEETELARLLSTLLQK